MIFDKQSFLAGLHTGLRLGRDPIGRNPPPPHERYIWTETEKNIITEYEAPKGNMSIYDNGGSYPATTVSGTPGCRVRIVRISEDGYDDEGHHIELPSEMRYFWWARSVYDYPGDLILYSPNESDLLNATYQFQIYSPDGLDITPSSWVTILSVQKVGDIYMINMTHRTWKDSFDHTYTIDGIDPYIGSPAEFFEMMENAQPEPFITE